MYDDGMIRMETKNGECEMTNNYIGCEFRGVRKDGRVFAGIVQDMRTVKGRTLIVIRQLDDAYKSFYMEDMTGGHSFSMCNGQPVIITGEGKAVSDYRKVYNDMVALHPVPMDQT